MSDSRTAILNACRKHRDPAVSLPELQGPWITYDDPLAHFAEVLQAVGGSCVVANSPDDVNRTLTELPAFSAAKRVCSTVPDIGVGHASADYVDLTGIDDPHELADVDFAILPGQFAVAETAAVWITDQDVRHRTVYYIAQHLALIIPANALVQNMHEAYDRLAFPERSFGCFISGPSKTADIEQSLVIGAHGPRSLTVFLLK